MNEQYWDRIRLVIPRHGQQNHHNLHNSLVFSRICVEFELSSSNSDSESFPLHHNSHPRSCVHISEELYIMLYILGEHMVSSCNVNGLNNAYFSKTISQARFIVYPVIQYIAGRRRYGLMPFPMTYCEEILFRVFCFIAFKV